MNDETEESTGFFTGVRTEVKKLVTKEDKPEKVSKRNKLGMSLEAFTEYMRNGDSVTIGDTVYSGMENGSYVKLNRKGVKNTEYLHYLTVKSQLGQAKLSR